MLALVEALLPWAKAGLTLVWALLTLAKTLLTLVEALLAWVTEVLLTIPLLAIALLSWVALLAISLLSIRLLPSRITCITEDALLVIEPWLAIGLTTHALTALVEVWLTIALLTVALLAAVPTGAPAGRADCRTPCEATVAITASLHHTISQAAPHPPG